MWVFPKIGVPQNGLCIMENPIKMDDLGVPPFSETTMSCNLGCTSQGVVCMAEIAPWLATSSDPLKPGKVKKPTTFLHCCDLWRHFLLPSIFLGGNFRGPNYVVMKSGKTPKSNALFGVSCKDP